MRASVLAVERRRAQAALETRSAAWSSEHVRRSLEEEEEEDWELAEP